MKRKQMEGPIYRKKFVPTRVGRLISRVAKVHPRSSAQALAKHLLSRTKPYTVAFLNQQGLTLALGDSDFESALQNSDLILRDGVALKLLLSRHQRSAGINMNGTDFIPILLEAARGARVAFYGTSEPWIVDAVAQASSRYSLSEIDSLDGFRNVSEYTERARKFCPRLIVLGMGMPKQELIARQLKLDLDFPCVIVSGGAFLDFLAGRFPRAPVWMRAMGLEWMFRLSNEPLRLWRRYLIGAFIFLRILFMPAKRRIL